MSSNPRFGWGNVIGCSKITPKPASMTTGRRKRLWSTCITIATHWWRLIDEKRKKKKKDRKYFQPPDLCREKKNHSPIHVLSLSKMALTSSSSCGKGLSCFFQSLNWHAARTAIPDFMYADSSFCTLQKASMMRAWTLGRSTVPCVIIRLTIVFAWLYSGRQISGWKNREDA